MLTHEFFYRPGRYSSSGASSLLFLMGSAVVCEEVGAVNIQFKRHYGRELCHSAHIIALTSLLTLSTGLGANRSGLEAESLG